MKSIVERSQLQKLAETWAHSLDVNDAMKKRL